jgi:carbonic anhydrase
MSAAKEFEQANAKYASSFDKGDLALPPARKVVVIICMDARIDPAAALGLKEGDAHVLAPGDEVESRLFAMRAVERRMRSGP